MAGNPIGRRGDIFFRASHFFAKLVRVVTSRYTRAAVDGFFSSPSVKTSAAERWQVTGATMTNVKIRRRPRGVVAVSRNHARLQDKIPPGARLKFYGPKQRVFKNRWEQNQIPLKSVLGRIYSFKRYAVVCKHFTLINTFKIISFRLSKNIINFTKLHKWISIKLFYN
jgi:hypothetical protein